MIEKEKVLTFPVIFLVAKIMKNMDVLQKCYEINVIRDLY